MDLSDAQWAILAPLIPAPARRADGRGRPWRDAREVLDCVLWVLNTGARWRDLPDRFPPCQTCHRRFQQWVRSGLLERVPHTLAASLLEHDRLHLSEGYIDGTFVPAKRGGAGVGPTERGKRTRIMAVADRRGVPIALSIHSASPHEVTLVEQTLATTFVNGLPERLIGDRAYDSDKLDGALRDCGVEMIAPHRRGRRKTQDGSCAVTAGAGKWSGSSRGCSTGVVTWFATSTTRRTSGTGPARLRLALTPALRLAV